MWRSHFHLASPHLLRWEFIKENKKARKQERKKEKKENKNSTKKVVKKKRKKFFFFSWSLSCRVLAFFLFFLFSWSFSWSSSCFLVFYYKFPPLDFFFITTVCSRICFAIFKYIVSSPCYYKKSRCQVVKKRQFSSCIYWLVAEWGGVAKEFVDLAVRLV